MALPHLPPRINSARSIYEESIVRRRAAEETYRGEWQGTANYYHNAQVRAQKQAGWTSDKAFQDSMNAWAVDKEKELESLKLAKRRERLGSLLERERHLLEAEIKGLKLENSARLDGMRYRIDSLKSSREETRKETSEQLLYEHFRQNNPELRQIAAGMAQEEVVEAWSDQVEQKQEIRRELLEEQAALDAQVLEQARRAQERALEEQRRRYDEEAVHRRQLEIQMDEIRAREDDQRKWKEEEARLAKEMDRIHVVEQQRRLLEDRRKQEEHGRALLRQHKAALMRKSQRIQAELQEDLHLLQALAEAEEAEKHLVTARRGKQRDEAVAMRNMLQDQLREEKMREAELDALFADEAAREWEKRQQVWQKESQARARLMQDVLKERQEQIQQRMEVAQDAQEENLREREYLLVHMESLAARAAEEERQREIAITARRGEINDQVQRRRRQQEEELFARAHDQEEAARGEEAYNRLIEEEAARLRQERGTSRAQTGRQLTHRR